MPSKPNRFELVTDPGTPQQRRRSFTVSEADIDDAVDYGRAERCDGLDRQLSGTAYHVVMDLRVCGLDELERPWVILRNGAIIGRNHLAARTTETDVA